MLIFELEMTKYWVRKSLFAGNDCIISVIAQSWRDWTCSLSFETQPLYHFKKQQSWWIASDRLTSCACLEKESALAIMAAVLSSSSPSFCPLSSRAILARANSPTTPDAAPFMPSIPPGPGMCWARLREALPADTSPTAGENKTRGIWFSASICFSRKYKF